MKYFGATELNMGVNNVNLGKSSCDIKNGCLSLKLPKFFRLHVIHKIILVSTIFKKSMTTLD